MKNPKKKIRLGVPALPKRLTRKKKPEAAQVSHGAPRITNETVAAHREEVLSSARKYIYPLQHSKHRVVKISIGLLVVAVVGFFVFCGLALYKFQSTSAFMYGVTQVLPVPVAKAGSSYVSYSSYLFELRHYMHYYETQQKVSFETAAGKQQLQEFKQRSMEQVIEDAYVKQLAAKHKVSVSQREVNEAVSLVRSQNRLGSNEQVFRDVLKEFWGWSVADFKRELRQELLAQKVVNKLDTGVHKRADGALAQLKSGTDFATLAKQVSDDTTTKENGGEFGIAIERSNRDIAPQTVTELFKLKPGAYSGVIDTGYDLEIVKVLEVQNDKVRAAHMTFNFQPLTTYTAPLQQKHKPHRFISV